ncbi:hypothetical protein AB0O76_28530 [Streptomyces sp. NPDC086554]|uniref:hypothetical protein n=1 Tax=Streptomyces sp. NPDC086554 TaxID=3154864 RepID=UPI00343715F7
MAVPAGGARIAGVQVAAFRDRSGIGLDMRALPQPVVTVVLGFADDMLTVDGTTGRQTLGGLVAAPFPGPTRIRGERVECVELHLSPVVASGLLGVAPSELNGAVADVDDLWGRQARLMREQLAAATTWPQRFALVDAFLARRRGGVVQRLEESAERPAAEAELGDLHGAASEPIRLQLQLHGASGALNG